MSGYHSALTDKVRCGISIRFHADSKTEEGSVVLLDPLTTRGQCYSTGNSGTVLALMGRPLRTFYAPFSYVPLLFTLQEKKTFSTMEQSAGISQHFYSPDMKCYVSPSTNA